LNASRKVGVRLDFERLDGRLLLSGGVTAALSRGVLTVRANDVGDSVAVDVLSSAGRGRRAPLRGTVVVEGVAQFPLAKVKAVVVQGVGADVIAVNQSGPAQIPVQINGGLGGNIIRALGPNVSIVSGPAPSFINGAWDRPPIVVPPVTTPPVTTPPVTTPPVTTPPVTTPPVTTPPVTTTSVSIEQQIVNLVNQFRQAAGLAPLTVDSKLTEAAQIQANNMASLNTMSHNLPGTATPTLQSRAQFVGYSYSWLGENIAYNYSNATAVMNAWMNSPDHRANILDPNYTQIGVAVAYSALGEPYYTQEFGAPA
jgi:uncharacterized protein YkwD